MSHHAISCTIEPLGPVQGGYRYALVISTALSNREGGTDLPQRSVFMPWTWTLVSIACAHRDGAGNETVPVSPLPPGLSTTAANVVRAELEKRYDEIIAAPALDRLLWGAATDGAEEFEAERDIVHWPTQLGSAALLPFPVPHQLNLAFVFTATRQLLPDSLVAPVFDGHTPVPMPSAQDFDDKRWPYQPAAAQLYAYSNLTPVPTADGFDPQTLWVDLSGNRPLYGEDWKARLSKRLGDALDAPKLLLNSYRQVLGATPTLPADELRALTEAVFQGMHDRAHSGLRSGPDEVSLVGRWYELKLPAADQMLLLPERPISHAAWNQILINRWKTPERTTLESGVAGLEQMNATLNDPATLALVVIDQWRLRGDVPAISLDQLTAELASPSGPGPVAIMETTIVLGRSVLGSTSPSGNRLWSWLSEPGIINDSAALRGRIEKAVVTYTRWRLGLPPDDAAVPAGLFSSTLPPQVDSGGAARVWNRIANEVRGAAARIASQAVPPTLVDAPANPQQLTPAPDEPPADRVPAPLVVPVLPATPMETGPADQGDVLRAVKGFGLMIRRPNDARWSFTNLVSAGVLESELGSPRIKPKWHSDELLLAARRLGYQEGVRDSVLIYDNAPLCAAGPDAFFGDHGAITEADLDERQALLHYLYPRTALDNDPADPVTLPAGEPPGLRNLVALRFGDSYQVTAFGVTNGGRLPVELTSPNHPALFRPPPVPGDLVPHARTFTYRRTVAVGSVRLSTRDGRETADPARLLPALPELVFPRAFEMAGTTVDPALVPLAGSPDARRAPLLLIAERGAGAKAEVIENNYRLHFRPPATDIQTWLRWTSPTGDAVRRAWTVLDYYHKLRSNHNETDAARAQSLSLDDPAVEQLHFELIDHDQPAAAPQVVTRPLTLKPFENVLPTSLPRLDPGYIRGATCNPVDVTLRIEGPGDFVVQAGHVYQLNAWSLIRETEFRSRFGKRAVGIRKTVQVGGVSYVAISPQRMWVEVASSKTMPDQVTDRRLSPTLWNRAAAAHDFALGHVEASIELPVNVGPNVYRCDLLRQLWSWQGRLPATVKALEDGAATQWPRGWVDDEIFEAIEFGTRLDVDHSLERMNVDDANSRRWLYRLERDRGRATYYRVAIAAVNRYQGVFDRDLTAFSGIDRGKVPTMWRGVVLPARPPEKVIAPIVRAVVPLTDVAHGEFLESTLPGAPAPTPGLLIVLDEPAYELGGLAERYTVQLGTSESGLQEFSVDPMRALKNPPNQKVQEFTGLYPIGHTFDAGGGRRKWLATSIVVPFPKATTTEQQTTRDIDGAWYFARVRVGRYLDPKYCIKDVTGARPSSQDTTLPGSFRGLVGEWSAATWQQYLPAFSILDTAIRLDELRMKIMSDSSVMLTEKNGAPAVLQPAQGFRYFGALTRRVVDIAGRPNAEAFITLLRRDDNDRSVYRFVEDGSGVRLNPNEDPDQLVLRILEVQMFDEEWSEAAQWRQHDFWTRVFSLTEADFQDRTAAKEQRRIRVVRVSTPVTNVRPESNLRRLISAGAGTK